MNREQRERVEDLSRGICDSIEGILNAGEDRPMTARDEDGGDVDGGEEEVCVDGTTSHLQQPLHFLNKANYQPHIEQANNGFIVNVGCQRFVFETYDKMSKYLKMYFEDPNGTESKFNANELFK